MTSLGKIFIYENDANQIDKYVQDIEAQGFFTFGTDNLYKFLKYSEEVNPDVVIMNFSSNFEADDKTWVDIEKSLCRSKCPQIYINARTSSKNPAFHYTDFVGNTINKNQILNILSKRTNHTYLH